MLLKQRAKYCGYAFITNEFILPGVGNSSSLQTGEIHSSTIN